jgi:hypothetical protein
MPRNNWTPAKYKSAIKVLKKHTTLAEAAAELGVTKDSLMKAFERNKDTAGRHLQKKETPLIEVASHPLAITRAKQHAAAERMRVKQLEQEYERLERMQEGWSHLQSAEFTIPQLPLLDRARRQGVPFMLLSDLHVDEEVKPDSVAGRNEFNLKIAESSLARCFDAFAYLIEKDRGIWDIDQAGIWLGGDLGTLYVHNESPTMSPVASMLWLREQLVAGIDHVLKQTGISKLIIPWSYGNHGRLTKFPQRATGWDNSLESVLGLWLKDYYASHDDRVEFHITKSAHQYVRALNTTIHFHHGDELKFGGGVGGLAIPLGKRVMKWENVIDSDLHCIGHWHTLLFLGHTVVNGSLKGYDAYAMSIGVDYEPPQQAYFMIDESRGESRGTKIWARSSSQMLHTHDPVARMV